MKPRPGLPEHAFNKILEQHHGQATEKLDNLDIHIVQVPAKTEDAVVQALSRNPHIKFAEKDLLVELSETIPNDPNYANAWHLPKIDAPLAWDSTLGGGITVAILDTGVDSSHPDLSEQLLSGWNTASNNSDTSDVMGHGTMVAGVVAAASNNGTGVASIAWNATLMPVRVSSSSDGSASYSAIANGLTWASDHGAQVANISYEVNNSSTVTNAAQYMRNRGGVVVVAAGNSGSDLGYSDNPQIISVSATTSSGAKASWSSYGSHVDVAAPGAGIWTTTRGGGYSAPSGTSFSSPTAAGVVALIMAANPNLSPDEVENVLENSAIDPISGSDWHQYYGYGRVDAAAAVATAINSPANDRQAPAVTIFSPTAGSTVQGLVPVEVSASDNESVSEVQLYAGSNLVGIDTLAPYQFSWDTSQVADGTVPLVAYAYDAANNEGVSNPVAVTVDNVIDPPDTAAPNVWFTNPSDGATVSRTVQVNISADDNIAVTNLRLYIDGALKASVDTGSLAYSWNTRKVNSGSHVMKAVATDTAGNSSEALIQVTVGGSSKGGGKGRKK